MPVRHASTSSLPMLMLLCWFIAVFFLVMVGRGAPTSRTVSARRVVERDLWNFPQASFTAA